MDWTDGITINPVTNAATYDKNALDMREYKDIFKGFAFDVDVSEYTDMVKKKIENIKSEYDSNFGDLNDRDRVTKKH